MVRKLHRHHKGLDQHGAQTKMHHKRPQVGCLSPNLRVPKESVLRVVRRPDRLHFNHCQPVGTRVREVVEVKQRQSVSIHG